MSLRTGGDDRPWRRCYVRFNSSPQIHSSLFSRSVCRHLWLERLDSLPETHVITVQIITSPLCPAKFTRSYARRFPKKGQTVSVHYTGAHDSLTHLSFISAVHTFHCLYTILVSHTYCTREGRQTSQSISAAADRELLFAQAPSRTARSLTAPETVAHRSPSRSEPVRHLSLCALT